MKTLTMKALEGFAKCVIRANDRDKPPENLQSELRSTSGQRVRGAVLLSVETISIQDELGEKLKRITDAGHQVDGIAYRDAHGWWCIGCGGSVVTRNDSYHCERCGT